VVEVSMNELGFVIMAVVGALAICFVTHQAERRRSNAIRAIANRAGFHYIGEALPRSLTLHGTLFERASKVWNVIDGEPRGIRIIAFDCRVGVGKYSWKRTIIAIESDAEFSSAVAFNPEMTVEFVGRWKILYRSKATIEFRISGLMPIEQLEAHLNSIAAPSSRQPLLT